MPDNNLDPIKKPPPTMVFDAARYQHLLDDSSVSQEESEAFLRAMWDLIVVLMDFGLRVEFENIDPQASKIRSKGLDAAIEGMLKSEHIVSIDKKSPGQGGLGVGRECADE